MKVKNMATILFRTLIVYLVISLVLRLMGKRQVGELELSDLVATLLLSEVAALPIADHNMPLLNALLPVLLILSLEIMLTFLKNKAHWLKKALEIRPTILICRGELDQKELTKMRMSIEELLSECRLQGYSDLADINYALLEQDGQLSIIPKDEERPLTPGDMAAGVQKKGMAHPVILDGRLNDNHLKLAGRNRAWVRKECRARGCSTQDVLLMTVDDAENITFIRKEKKS